MAGPLSSDDIKDLQQFAASLPPNDPRVPKISLLLNSQPSQFEQDVANDPSLLTQPKEYLAKRAEAMGQSAQDQMNKAVGPESMGKSVASQLGHAALSYLPATAQVVDKGVSGLLDWKNDAAIASGAIDPMIPAAYFATSGTSDLTGVGKDGPGLIQQTVNNPSPDNVQNTLLSGATVAGSVAGGLEGGPRNIPAPVRDAANNLASRWYQSALKPPTGDLGDARAMVNTGLQNGIPVSEAGVAKISSLVDQLNQTISSEIAEGSKARTDIGTEQVTSPAVAGGTSADIAAGLAARRAQSQLGSMASVLPSRITGPTNAIADSLGSQASTIPDSIFGPKSASVMAKQIAQATVDPRDVVTRLDDLRDRFSQQVAPESDLAAIDSVKQEFLRNNPDAMSASDAQALKVGTYRQLSSRNYSEQSSATIEAQKQLARGLKEEIETQFPEISSLNSKESQLLGLNDALQRAVARIGNRDIYSIGGKIATAGGGALAGATHGVYGAAGGALAATILHRVITDPVVKSRIAMGLYRASRGGVSARTAAARVQMYSNALGSAASAANQNGANQQ